MEQMRTLTYKSIFDSRNEIQLTEDIRQIEKFLLNSKIFVIISSKL